MCGIFGQIETGPRPPERSGQELAHRGPDDQGHHLEAVGGGAAWLLLGHRRLAILDLSPTGHQPMPTRDQQAWITFNGEIYNFAELRSELEGRGHRFSTHSDTEAILYGYREWGDAVVTHLRGMFAFALWDRRRQRLLLARDRIGKKPMFYTLGPRRLLFGSEIKSILAAGHAVVPDYAALSDYLTYFYFPAPTTAFRGIQKLPPAHCLAVEVHPGGELTARQWEYWDPLPEARSQPSRAPADYIEELSARVAQAVSLRLVSDVPVGVFLSGGLDSTSVAAFAARCSPMPLRTFTVSFPGNRNLNETERAGWVARHLDTHHLEITESVDCARDLLRVIRHFDEPFGNPTAVLALLLAHATSRHVKVALSGDGGDELFLGYPRHGGARLAQWLRRVPGSGVLLPRVARWMPEGRSNQPRRRRVREFLEFGGQDELEMYLQWIGYFSSRDKAEMFTADFARSVGRHDSGEFLRKRYARCAEAPLCSRLSYLDLGTFLAGNVLEYSDRMSMAHSLEVRCPFTDHELVEYVLRLPESVKMSGLRHDKRLLRKVAEPLLPPGFAQAPKKGFVPPLHDWLRAPLLQQWLSPATVARRGWFRPEYVRRLQEEYAHGWRDHSVRLWGLLALEIWCRLYLENTPAEELMPTANTVTVVAA